MRTFIHALGRSRLLLTGTILVALFVAVAVLAPVIAPYDPKDPSGPSLASPSWSHLLGTNETGADNLSRLIWGSRTALIVAVGATSVILVLGVAVGATAGLRGGFVDVVLMRVVDVFLAVPTLPVVIFVVALAGTRRSLALTIFMIAIFAWAEPARIVRSQTLTLRSRGYVDSARGFGAGPFYVIRRHLIPALGPIIAATLVYVAGNVIIIETALGFLGLGDPATVDWGYDIQRAAMNPANALGWFWVWWLLPLGLALVLAIFGFSLIGVGLEPQFNPRANRAR